MANITKNNEEITKPPITKAVVFSRLATAFVIVMLAVFPLYLNQQKYYGLTGHKATFLWTLMLLTALAMFILWLAFINEKKDPLKPRAGRLSVAELAALAYFVLLCVSAALSPFADTLPEGYLFFGNTDPDSERFDGLITHACYVAMFFIVSRLYKPHHRDMIIFAVSSCVLSLIGVFQFLGADLYIDRFLGVDDKGRPNFLLFPYGRLGMDYPYASQDIFFRTTLGNVDIVSAYVCITVVLFTALYCLTKERRRFFYLAAAVLSFVMMMIGDADSGKLGVLSGFILLFALIVTNRAALSRFFLTLGASSLLCTIRGAAVDARARFEAGGSQDILYWGNLGRSAYLWLGLFFILAAVGLHYLPVWFKASRLKAAGITLAAIAVIGVVGLNIVGARETNHGSVLWQANEVLHGRIEDEFGTNRGFIWTRTMTTISHHPLLGTGPDTFGQAFAEFQREAVEKTQVTYDKAHNDVLQVAVCSGLLGLAAYLAWIFGAVVRGSKRLFTSNLALAVTLTIVASFVQSLFGVAVPIATPLFFVLLGML
ncbi:hypothetical protein FACS1894202_05810 [Clostridia bacterium]|nr:hypothetical protein FACS1894202_05810 [Clostridia bacterium]